MTAEGVSKRLVVAWFLVALFSLVIAAAVVIIFLRPASPVSKAHRLAESGELIGWGIEELQSEFGAPVNTDYFSEWDFVFRIGPSSSYMAVDSSWLVVEVDGNGKVVAAKVVED